MDLWLPPKPAIIMPAPEIKRPVDFRPAILPGLVLPVVTGSSVTPISNAFQQDAIDINNNTTYTFTSQNIGAADPTRRVIVGLTWRCNGTFAVVSSATIAGSAATIHIQGASNTDSNAAFISLLVPTGTTATIVVNMSAGARNLDCAIWRQVNESSASPTATQTASAASNTVSLNINVPANGSLYACGNCRTSAAQTPFGWTGVTERYDVGAEADAESSGASETGLALETPRNVSFTTVGGSSPKSVMVAMSWG
jgi:hypothetical protein